MQYLKLMILQKRTFYTFRTVLFSIFADIYYNNLTIVIWYLHTIDTVDSFAFSFANGIWQCNSRDINSPANSTCAATLYSCLRRRLRPILRIYPQHGPVRRYKYAKTHHQPM